MTVLGDAGVALGARRVERRTRVQLGAAAGWGPHRLMRIAGAAVASLPLVPTRITASVTARGDRAIRYGK